MRTLRVEMSERNSRGFKFSRDLNEDVKSGNE